MRRTGQALGVAAAALALTLVAAGTAAARPSYFATFTGIYGLVEGEDLYACGVCHRRWEGTGARNPYGSAVEQQLYIGKLISDAILDIEAADSDGDGFTNVDEIAVHGTLPGYACDNYTLAIDPPPNFQSLITPFVPSCLEPKDVLIAPEALAFVTQVNKVDIVPVAIVNNGTDDPITVSAYELLPGAHAALGLSGPATPIVIPVGQQATVDVSFSPLATGLATGTLRITSDDPDEPTIDVPLSGIAFVKNLAPADTRAACFKEAERRLEVFSKQHLKEWGRCYLDELRGLACDTGRRDFKTGLAEAKLRAAVGGAKDRRCAGAGLTPTLLDLPLQCGAPCAGIQITSIATWADCLVCRQSAATVAMLDAAVGTEPPDLPLNLLGADAHRCNRSLVNGVRRAARKIQKALGACRLENVTAGSPVDCDAVLASAIAQEAARADAVIDRCRDTTDMLGCLFVLSPDPQCVGDASQAIAEDLVDAVFETRD